jgi:ribosomal protein S18 acetylase RimI-like enzyme
VAVDRGVRVLYLHVDAHNDAAIRLYLRAGFQRVEETMETIFASLLKNYESLC